MLNGPFRKSQKILTPREVGWKVKKGTIVSEVICECYLLPADLAAFNSSRADERAADFLPLDLLDLGESVESSMMVSLVYIFICQYFIK